MIIREFPELKNISESIASVELEVFHAQRSQKQIESAIALHTAKTEMAIATDPDLKNELMRKSARIIRLDQDVKFCYLVEDLAIAEVKTLELEITLRSLKREFKIDFLESSQYAIAK